MKQIKRRMVAALHGDGYLDAKMAPLSLRDKADGRILFESVADGSTLVER